MSTALTIERLSPEEAQDLAPILADILIDSVEGGASVGFMSPLSRARADGFWRGIVEAVARGDRLLLAARDGQAVLGTVQLGLAQPENQPHRADLSKLLVRRSARGRGVGAVLMRAAEAAARQAGKTLLVLDTATEEAERLYERAGWTRVGAVPGYALFPDGRPGATTYFYKTLTSGGGTEP
jgi:GNAT superfamily N-acetyltransferase